ncbi:MAG: DNA polymerase III subunit chi [Rhodobacteraceae bacterium]|nr:DNA polymerase III subunit chi [Paracoccaceae bacterium]
MAEAHFYHLTRDPLERVLPVLLVRGRERGWRICIRWADEAAMHAMDARLWAEPEDGFLPHGLDGTPEAPRQPVLLTLTEGPAANGAQMLMAVAGARLSPVDAAAAERLCLVFDGTDPARTEEARAQWRMLTAAGLPARYWSQESGRWQEKARSG